ncbi:MAG: tRNA guanosine(34) transglycosylase Tgt [Deltaproteobacteria bacterium]|nr:tRNA guanosine(34) transglycosylase Tgt [Deltaproteobacteria bacterium]
MKLPTDGFEFEVVAQDGPARCGRLTTPRAVVETPVFMPVGTQAFVKSQTPDEVAATGARIILANTYHLMLRPGSRLIARLGGTHAFMGWPFALLTDSGGFQVFSFAHRRKIDEDGVTFRSHIDGSEHRLTPERSMQIQAELGSDIAMVLDECPEGTADRLTVEQAVRRSTAWAERCLAYEKKTGQARFGIVQGSTFVDLRLSHLETLSAMPFDGIALGGFSVGEPISEMYRALSDIGPRMPIELPRYLMGVGTPIDLLHAVGAGLDMFDCVLPTRNARNGQALTWSGRVNIKQARNRDDLSPLDDRCDCPVCKSFSRAYLRHMAIAGEMLVARLMTQHNLYFYADLMRRIREAIREGRFQAFARETEKRMREQDEVGR